MRLRTLMSLLLPALIAAVFATGTLAAPAHAAVPMRTWNKLAQCESNGNWRINTGNGYYGGLQISGNGWRWYGGGRYSRFPHQATKREQIRIATKILRREGWGSWPTCSRRLGLR